jgi:glucuronoarabinoxylan endo-1,4-beta-xylanase
MNNHFKPSNLARFLAVSGLFLGVLFQTGIAAAQNLVTNPGFETGDTSGWFGFGSTTTLTAETSVVHTGSYAALVSNRTATYMGIAQSFQGVLQSGTTYSISAWLQLAKGPSQTMYLTMQQEDGAGVAYNNIATGTIATNVWTLISGQFTFNYSGTLTSLVLYAEMPTSATNSYYIDDVSVTPAVTAPPTNGQCLVDWTNVFQRIDGFGASSAWNGGITSAQANMFFSTNTGIGLSLLRSRIAPDGTTVETSIMQMAQALGARVWSSPWSPPATMKGTNTSGVISVNGGPLIGNSTNYQAYASQLAGYVARMKSSGVNIYAVSVQNEPDTDTTGYESCTWTAQQFHDFIPYFSAALTASNVASTKILFPESFSWANHLYFQQTTMNDPAVAPLVGIIADHNYDGVNFDTGDMNPPAAINNYGKGLWETEVSTGDAFNGSITNALYWAGRVHQFMTVAQANAFHYWWLISANADNEGLTDNAGNPAKRMYALGNFSRFVRPNFYRIGVDTNFGPLQISAYKEPPGGHFAIVAINPATNPVSQVFNLSGFATTNVTSWITSATQSLVSQGAMAVTGNVFTSTVPALSIVTFVGAATTANLPPTLAPVANSTIGAGMTLTITNVATDPNIPALPLTFSLLTGPTNATLNSFSGIFSWQPLVSQADSTNFVTAKVADNGTPALSATNSFMITVTPLASPVITSINSDNGQWILSATGALGPNYTLSTSTNLSNWQALITTNPLAMPLTLTATNGLEPQRFYRLQLGP